jgi:hypothetical protein
LKVRSGVAESIFGDESSEGMMPKPKPFTATACSLKGSVMKFGIVTAGVISMGLFLVTLTGCQTESPGTTDTLGYYSTVIDGPPDEVTTAAQKAAGDLKLSDIVGNSTKVDGRVTARNAQGTDVTIDIKQAGEGVSKVTIRVGMTGDEVESKQLMDRIKSHL